MGLFVLLKEDNFLRNLLQQDLNYIELKESKNDRWCHSGAAGIFDGFCFHSRDISNAEYRHHRALFLCSCRRLLHGGAGRRQIDRDINQFDADVVLCDDIRDNTDHKRCLDQLREEEKLSTLKDLMLFISRRLRHLKAIFGAELREKVMPFCSSSHGCEVESVALRDHMCLSTQLFGKPELPFHIVNGSMTGGCDENDMPIYAQSSFITKLAQIIDAYEVDGKDRISPKFKLFRQNNKQTGLCKRINDSNDVEGIIKLTSLLTSVWRWDEVCVYFGGSPGSSIYYTLHLRGFKNKRSIIIVDPRPLDERLSKYATSAVAKKREIRIEYIRGLVPQCFNELRTKLANLLKVSGKNKFFIFSDIRSDEAANLGHTKHDWSMAHDEDAMAYMSVNHLISSPVLSDYTLTKSVCKVKVSPKLVFQSCCDRSWLIPQFVRYDKKYELRLYSRGTCHYWNHLPFSGVYHDYSELIEVWDRKPFWVRSKQCALIAQLDISEMNAFEFISRPNDLRMDLFYATNLSNYGMKMYTLMQKSDISTFWVGESNPYNDFSLQLDISELYSLEDRCVFYGSQFMEFLNKGRELFRPQYVVWEDSFLICISHRMLVELGLFPYLYANTYGNCQTFGFRRLLNEERALGCISLENIDTIRREAQDDHFSGHLIGMSILSKNKRRYYDIRRWLMLLIGNWIINGLIELKEGPMNAAWLENLNQMPECRDGTNLWHSFDDITYTLDLLTTRRILNASVADAARRFISKHCSSTEQRRVQT